MYKLKIETLEDMSKDWLNGLWGLGFRIYDLWVARSIPGNNIF